MVGHILKYKAHISKYVPCIFLFSLKDAPFIIKLYSHKSLDVFQFTIIL